MIVLKNIFSRRWLFWIIFLIRVLFLLFFYLKKRYVVKIFLRFTSLLFEILFVLFWIFFWLFIGFAWGWGCLFIGSDMVDIWRLSLDVFVVFFNVKMSNIICIFIFFAVEVDWLRFAQGYSSAQEDRTNVSNIGGQSFKSLDYIKVLTQKNRDLILAIPWKMNAFWNSCS